MPEEAFGNPDDVAGIKKIIRLSLCFAVFRRTGTADEKTLFPRTIGKTATHRDRIDDLHALDISIAAGAFHLTEDIKGAVVRHFDGDTRLAQLTVRKIRHDFLFEFTDCLAARLDFANQRICDRPRSADLENTARSSSP